MEPSSDTNVIGAHVDIDFLEPEIDFEKESSKKRRRETQPSRILFHGPVLDSYRPTLSYMCFFQRLEQEQQSLASMGDALTLGSGRAAPYAERFGQRVVASCESIAFRLQAPVDGDKGPAGQVKCPTFRQ